MDKMISHHDGLCYPWHHTLRIYLYMNNMWQRVTKPIPVVKIPCKILCAIDAKVFDKQVALTGIRAFEFLIHSQIS